VITRKELADHIAKFPNDDPEYGGTIVDWVWDWLVVPPAAPARSKSVLRREAIQRGEEIPDLDNYEPKYTIDEIEAAGEHFYPGEGHA